MNRLQDDAVQDPASKVEIEWLRKTPPTPSMPDMRRRVWNALQQSSLARVAGPSSRVFGRPGIKVAVVLLGATVLALAGTAAAMIASRWVAPMLERSAWSSHVAIVRTRSDDARAARGTAGLKARNLASASAPTAALSGPAPIAPSLPPPVAPSRVTLRRAPIVPGAHGAARSVARPVGGVTPNVQARTEVLDALVALRRDHDPARAGALLDKYLADHGRGALREEALALAIEAADARGDHVRGRRLARTYEAEFPQGRFRQFARSHVESGGARQGITRPWL